MVKRISENSTIFAVSNLISKRLDSGDVYLIKDGIAFGLNPVAERIWELIQQPIRVNQVREALLREYEVDFEQCNQELLELLGELAANGLVEICDGEPA